MKIWVDIATPPQVLFLCPIINELRTRGYDVLTTIRDSTETIPLADKYGLKHIAIGYHGGQSSVGKTFALVYRAAKLMRFVRHEAISLAVSQGSYSQALTAWWLHIPMITFQDYEGHPANHILCRVAKKILVPNVFCKANLYDYGASEDKVESYGGMKENVYLAEFKPEPSFLEKTGIPSDRIVITMRPPNLVAAYHRFENPLFDELLHHLLQHKDIFVVILPRGLGQYQKYKEMRLPNVMIPEHVLDGPNLIFYSDLVIGAGGTINREAAALGTPVYTLFKGRMGSIDQHLIKSDKMVWIKDSADFSKIRICKKPKALSNTWAEGNFLLKELIDKVLNGYMQPCHENVVHSKKNGIKGINNE